jgi:potassium efflux system protein
LPESDRITDLGGLTDCNMEQSQIISVMQAVPDRPLYRRFFGLLPVLATLAVSLLLASTPVLAQEHANEKSKEKEPKALVSALDDIENRLKYTNVENGQTLADWIKEIGAIKEVANKCVPATQENLKKINDNLASLGKPIQGEAVEVARQRSDLKAQKTDAENRLATCKVLIQRSDELLPKIADLQKHVEARRLLARGPTIVEVFSAVELDPRSWFSVSWSYLRDRSVGARFTAGQWGSLALVILIAASFGVWLHRVLLHWTVQHRWHGNLASQVGRCLVTGVSHYLPHLLASTAMAVFFFYATSDIDSVPLATLFSYGLPPYFLAFVTIHLFLAPFPPAEAFVPVPAQVAGTLATRFKILVTLVFLAYLVFASLLARHLSEPALFMARALFALAFFVSLSRTLWLLRRASALAQWQYAALMLALVAALIDELVGLRNLSLAIMRAFAGTLLALGIFGLITRLLHELFDGLQSGRQAWHRRIRQALALNPGDPIPGLAWVRVITIGFLWGVLLVVILELWGLPPSYLQQLFGWVAGGFTVGSLHVNPARIILGVVTLTVLLALSGWVRSRMKRRWLAKARMDRGAREATVTMSGYLGVAIAILVALAVSGFEFTNLAIIAGALSVGIGFGLQAIVNNFVSGLILLFERPIKTGDWIVVGNTEGYVKKISIRSTLIQTFDRADVIVPNSDLISNQVTNWMLYDPRGRIRVPVGVAYGSDTGKVRDILLEIARGHPEVICDGTSPQPRVLFLTFGESSLNFELRCHIQNIDMRRMVISDLNFAIDKAFRENGVEIPFPQRDVHVRDWTEMKKQTRTGERR